MGHWQNYWRKKDHTAKSRVESYRCLDSSNCYDTGHDASFDKKAYVNDCSLQLFASHVQVTISSRQAQYDIPVVATKCNYGGQRHWFLCPAVTCNRRSKKLYFHPTGFFVCRKCLNLAYESQNSSKLDRIIDKKWKLVHILGGDTSTRKPKGMHQRTFQNMQAEIEHLDMLASQGIAERCWKPFM